MKRSDRDASKEDRIMSAIQRNGLSGLALKIAAIAFAAIMSGFMAKPSSDLPFTAQAEASRAADL
jgi:hypothetical protein